MSFEEKIEIAANQYPNKKKSLARFFRSILCYIPRIGFVASSARPRGISFYMRVKDESDWIRPSVQSIIEIADEIVVVDNGSTDGTLEILKELETQNQGRIKLWLKPVLNHCQLSNFALKQTSFHWVLRWDGDMVAHTSGQYNIIKLKERI